MNKCVSPSLMCCDFFKMEEIISAFEKADTEYFHFDIMDGTFVPNYTLGTDFIRQIKKRSSIPADIHLMVENPDNKIDYFDLGKGDIVSVHVETTKHLQRLLTKIRQKGARPFVAINPATPLSSVEEVLDDIDGLVIMTVNPGFAGQKLIPSTLDKIRRARKMLDERGKTDVEIEVDGNVSYENAKLMSEAGANIFVAGTSSVFAGDIIEGMAKIRKSINV